MTTTEEPAPSDAPAAPTGELSSRATGTRAVLVLLGTVVLGFALTVLAAFDVRYLGRWTVVIVALAAAVLCAVAAGASAVTAVVEWRWPTRTRFPGQLRWWFGIAAVVLVAFTTWVLSWLLAGSGLDTSAKWGILVVALGGAMVGVAMAWAVTDPDRWKGPLTAVGFWALTPTTGLAVGIVLAIAPVIVVSTARLVRADTPLPDPPAIDVDVDRVVALGDSYSAGEGLSPYLAGTEDVDEGGNRCHRSRDAYSQQLTFVEGPPDVTFVACSGALTGDLFAGHTEPRDDPAGPQVEAQVDRATVPDPDVDLVTVTIGGNDVRFAGVVRHCLEVDDCTDQPFPDDPGPTLAEWGEQQVDELGSRLGDAYADLRVAYPEARIVVLGYPYLFPSGPAGVTFSDCDTILRRVSTGERRELRGLQNDLTARIYAEARAADVEFVSTQAVWDGHEPCGDRGQYTNALNPVVFDGSFHPNLAGQRAYATLLACYLNSTDQPPPGAAVRLPWELEVTDDPPAPGTLARPVPCPEAEPGEADAEVDGADG